MPQPAGETMRIDRLELFLCRLPLVHFFETSFGRVEHRRILLVAVERDGVVGWGECTASEGPFYNEEFTDSAWHAIRDFVAPIGRYDPLPNLLHIGFEEARRLMGDSPDEGPMARVMRWAYGRPDEDLKLVHIRDWHDASDPAQRDHLAQFGVHCLKDTPGAGFCFAVPRDSDKAVTLVDSPDSMIF